MRKSSRRDFIKTAGTGAAAFGLPSGAAALRPSRPAEIPSLEPFLIWCQEPQRRVFSGSTGVFKPEPQINLSGCRGERVSTQVAFTGGRWSGTVRVACDSLAGSEARIRTAALIPCQELDMLVPDPLEDHAEIEVAPGGTRAFWLDFAIPAGTKPGEYKSWLHVRAGSMERRVPLRLEVLPATLPDPKRYGFWLSVWQDPAAIARLDATELWSDRHWGLIRAYARDSAAHGEKTITTTVVEDPWRSQTGFPFPSMVTWRRDGEWTEATSGTFHFDYSIFDRYVETLTAEGLDTIQCFSPTHKGAFAYYDSKAGKMRYRNYGVGDEWWASAWNQFLPDLIAHLRSRGWLSKTYLGMDEPKQATMEIVWPLLRRYAPDLKTYLAGGGGRYGMEAEDLCYYYFYLRGQTPNEPKPDPVRRRAEGKRTTIYVCTGPTHPNTFLYSPAYGSRMLPWLSWQLGYDGFVRWALNSWTARVWQQPRGQWQSGDNFLVYPGRNGPLDSIRWELLFAGIQDVECLKLAQQSLAERERSGASATLLRDCRNRLAAAVALATRDEDALITHRESNMGRARRALNQVLKLLV
jgi:hypothetical protein